MRGASVESKQGGARVSVPPPLVFVVAILVGAFLPGLRLIGAGSVAAGAVLFVAGLVFGGSAVVLFRRSGQDPKPWLPKTELLGRGPFRFSRNPMYVGFTLLTLGIGGLLSRGWILLLAPVALLALHYLAVLPEERFLTARFGEQYIKYKESVRRYL